MWFPRKDMMGKLQMATVEKLQPLRDTWMAAEGALLQAGHDYLQDNEVVVQKNANNKFRIGLWGEGFFFLFSTSLGATQCLAMLLPPLSPGPRNASWSG